MHVYNDIYNIWYVKIHDQLWDGMGSLLVNWCGTLTLSWPMDQSTQVVVTINLYGSIDLCLRFKWTLLKSLGFPQCDWFPHRIVAGSRWWTSCWKPKGFSAVEELQFERPKVAAEPRLEASKGVWASSAIVRQFCPEPSSTPLGLGRAPPDGPCKAGPMLNHQSCNINATGIRLLASVRHILRFQQRKCWQGM